MTTRSIFQKTCPACMITLPLDATDCACGHEFDQNDADATLSSEEIRLKAEELYKNYLAARAEQAASAVMAAQAEFARDPASAQKSQSVASAIEESAKARATLAAQSARVAEMRKALPKPASVPRATHIAAAPKKKLAAVKPVVAPAPVRATAKVVNHPHKDSFITATVRAKRAVKKAVSALAKIKPAPAPVTAKAVTTQPPVQTKTPNPAFRQAQAAKAEKILRQAETAAAVKAVIKEEPVVAPQPKPEPKPIPALAPVLPPVLTKSAPRLLGPDKKECPNCTSSVDSKLNRCRCGYEFSTSEALMPALSMSEEERAEFAKLFGHS